MSAQVERGFGGGLAPEDPWALQPQVHAAADGALDRPAAERDALLLEVVVTRERTIASGQSLRVRVVCLPKEAPTPDELPRDDTIPQSLPEFLERFGTEEKCARVLRRWRWPKGFRCPACGHDESWFIATRRVDECTRCYRQTSLTAGTVMHKSRTPLTKWFLAMYLFVSSKQGISGWDLARQVGLSYAAAWLWLHKLRSALGRRTTELLHGTVEVDETYEVGVRPGSGGGRPSVSDEASLIVGAIEVPRGRKGFGRLRLASLDAATGEQIGGFLEDNVAPGSTLLTDGFQSYKTEEIGASYDHVPIAVARSGRTAHECLPGIHRVFALLDRVLKGTYQGAVRRKHLGAYLEEFAFRFNRRHSKSRALLFQRTLSAAVLHAPPTCWDLVGRAVQSSD